MRGGCSVSIETVSIEDERLRESAFSEWKKERREERGEDGTTVEESMLVVFDEVQM